MTLNIQKTASENDFDNKNYLIELSVKDQICLLLKHKITGLAKGMLIPDDLIGDAERFMIRNMRPEMNYQFCPRCLKAHLMKKANEIGLTKREKEFLASRFEEETGHLGYYMDGEEIIKI